MELSWIKLPNGMEMLIEANKIIGLERFDLYVAETRGQELSEEGLMELQELVFQTPTDYDLIPVKGLISGKNLGYVDERTENTAWIADYMLNKTKVKTIIQL